MSRRPFSGANAAAVGRLAALVRRGRYDGVHAHSSIAGALARPAAGLSGRRPRLVYTPHGFAFLVPGARRRAAFLAVERALGRVTDRLIALTPTEAATAVECGVVPARRLVTIPNGVVSSQVPGRDRGLEVRRREGWDGVPLVGTLSRMTPQKRPEVWLHTAARIAQERPDARFAWIWGGEQEQAVRAQARDLGLEDRVQFLGYRPDARELIAAFDVFLLTSAFEGLPYSLMEAMASGVPVVATDVVGTRDVVRHGETGLLAPAGDAPALAAQVLQMLADPEGARRLAEAGRADVLARYSVDEMVRRTAELYRSLLED
jgi:glycosyltransferase involved in cell wall biosynthesis